MLCPEVPFDFRLESENIVSIEGMNRVGFCTASAAPPVPSLILGSGLQRHEQYSHDSNIHDNNKMHSQTPTIEFPETGVVSHPAISDAWHGLIGRVLVAGVHQVLC